MALPSCRCVGAYPNWKLLGPIVAAARTWAGESPDLHCFDNRPIIDQLRGLYCATLTVSGGGGGGGGATLLASFYIPEIVDTFERAIAAGFTGDGDPETFQREDAVDVLRDDHYQSGITGQLVILEDVPTECVLVAPENIVGVGGELQFDASWDDIPITVDLQRYEWRLDGAGGWNDNGVSTTITAGSATAGSHVLNVRSVSTSGALGDVGSSSSFTVDPSSAVWVYSQTIGSLDTPNAADNTTPLYGAITLASGGTISKLSVYTAQSVGGNVKIALYDSSKDLLASGSMAAPADAGAHDLEVDIPDTVVSSGSYYIGFLCDSTSLQDWRFANTIPSRLFKFGVAYGSFPNDPIAEDGSQNAANRVGVFISP